MKEVDAPPKKVRQVTCFYACPSCDHEWVEIRIKGGVGQCGFCGEYCTPTRTEKEA
jgi:transcription elongation factor Elf1